MNFGFSAALVMTQPPGELNASANIATRNTIPVGSEDVSTRVVDVQDFFQIFCVLHAIDTGKNTKHFF